MTTIFNRAEVGDKRKKLRNHMTSAEVLLWMELKGRRVANAKIRRQYSIGFYIVDFYCPEVRLVIEVDGGYHKESKVAANDRVRQAAIESLGIQFLRFTNEQVEQDRQGVVRDIETKVARMRSFQNDPLLTKEG